MVLPAVLLLQSSCAQNDKTGKEKILNLYKEVKSYDHSPSYMLNVNFRGCSIEILINDIPVYHNFFNNKFGGVGGDIHINENILSSGKQNIKMIGIVTKR